MRFKTFYPQATKIAGSDFEIVPVQDRWVLLQRRQEMKLTQQQVAEAAGIQLRQYQRIENGECTILGTSARIMLSVCEALKLDPYLFLGKGNEETDEPEIHETYVILPPISSNGMYHYIPQHAFYLMVSAIPYGMVCTVEEIWDMLKRVYAIDVVDSRPDYNSVDMYAHNAFPYWRLVSERGYITGSFYISKDRQIDMLQNEGHNIRQIGDVQKFRIMDFNDTHFDIQKLKVSVLQTDEQFLNKLNAMCAHQSD